MYTSPRIERSQIVQAAAASGIAQEFRIVLLIIDTILIISFKFDVEDSIFFDEEY